MTTTMHRRLDFVLDAAHEAHEPPEAPGRPRDHGRLLISCGSRRPVDARFDQLGSFLGPGDLIVVNTSATIAAALDGRLSSGEPIAAYQTVFAREPGSAEMPSASRPFTDALVTELVSRGVHVAPLLLHTGVSSLEGTERPYPERYRVSLDTAARINATHRGGGQVIAAGTTVVRALTTVTDEEGFVHPGAGWTDVVVTPDTPMTAVDGLLTGWHEPESSHLMMLGTFADHATLADAYANAIDLGYRWHEFGDSHLIVRERASR